MYLSSMHSWLVDNNADKSPLLSWYGSQDQRQRVLVSVGVTTHPRFVFPWRWRHKEQSCCRRLLKTTCLMPQPWSIGQVSNEQLHVISSEMEVNWKWLIENAVFINGADIWISLAVIKRKLSAEMRSREAVCRLRLSLITLWMTFALTPRDKRMSLLRGNTTRMISHKPEVGP